MKTLFILNDAPYGNERSYNALRLAGTLSKVEGEEVKVFLIGDAASCAKGGQKVPEGFYNIEVMLGRVVRNRGEVGACIEREFRHVFSPSFLWVMVGQRSADRISRPMAASAKRGIELIQGAIEHFDPADQVVRFDGNEITREVRHVASHE